MLQTHWSQHWDDALVWEETTPSFGSFSCFCCKAGSEHVLDLLSWTCLRCVSNCVKLLQVCFIVVQVSSPRAKRKNSSHGCFTASPHALVLYFYQHRHFASLYWLLLSTLHFCTFAITWQHTDIHSFILLQCTSLHCSLPYLSCQPPPSSLSVTKSPLS